MTAFEVAVDALFADPSIAEDATLERADQPDSTVRAAETAPAAGDVFVLVEGRGTRSDPACSSDLSWFKWGSRRGAIKRRAARRRGEG